MGGGIETEYHPIPENVEKYKALYEKYQKFGKFVEFDF
jgi:L-ribulokinase